MGIVSAVIWAIALMATPVGAEQSDIDKRFAPLFDKAAGELNAGQPAKALETVSPAVTEYERAYAGEKRRIYCGISSTQTLAALMRAANDKMSAVAVGEGYCTALYLRAFALVDVGQVSEAEVGFLRLVELAPFNARYVYELANIRRMTRRYETWHWRAIAQQLASLVSPHQVAKRLSVAPRGGRSAGYWSSRANGTRQKPFTAIA